MEPPNRKYVSAHSVDAFVNGAHYNICGWTGVVNVCITKINSCDVITVTCPYMVFLPSKLCPYMVYLYALLSRHVEVMSPEKLPLLCLAYLNLVTSKPFSLLLAHMTELELVENVKLDRGKGFLSESSENESARKLKSTTEADSDSLELKSTTVKGDSDSLELKSTALCRADWFRWREGCYNLAGDPTDPGLGRFCLEAISSFNSEGREVDNLMAT